MDVVAVFTDSGGNKEPYIGEMGTKLGIDANVKTEETLQYLVISLLGRVLIGGTKNLHDNLQRGY